MIFHSAWLGRPDMHRAAFLSLLESIGGAMASMQQLDSNVQFILDQIRAFFESPVAIAWLLSKEPIFPDSQARTLGAPRFWSGVSPDLQHKLEQLCPTSGEDRLLLKAVSSREPAWSDKLPEATSNRDQEYLRNMNQLGVRAILVIPALAGASLVGVLEFLLKEPFEAEEPVIEGLAQLSRIVGRVIEFKWFEGELAEARAARGTILDSIPDAAWFKDRYGRYVAVNEAYQRMLGKPAQQIIGQDDFVFWSSDVAERMRQDDQEVMLTGKRKRIEEETRQKRTVQDNRWYETVKTPIKDSKGRVIGTTGIARDITDRKRAEMAFEQEQKRFHSLFSQMDEGVALHRIVYGPEGKPVDYEILDVNPAYERSTGLRKESVVGRLATQVYGTDEAPYLDIYHEVAVTGQPLRFETCFVPLKKRFEISAVSYRQGEFATIFFDITQRKKAEAEREELLAREKAARVEADRANRTKDFFLATVSHELRTPLTAISTWAQLLNRGFNDPAKIRKGAAIIEEATRAQAELINDLLDVSRMTTGKLRLDMRPIRPAEVLRASIYLIRDAAEQKQIRIEYREALKDALVRADAGRLEQVFSNLLSNAIKFTPAGGTVRIISEVTDGESLQVRVMDTGKGISAEFLPHVFEAFTQAESSSTRRQGGLGIGLAIVKYLVEMHGGSVWAESAGEGKGAAFTVRFPIAKDQRSALEAATVGKGGNATKPLWDAYRAKLSGIRAVVVDDDPHACEAISELLQAFEMKVQVAHSAREGFDAVKAFKPHILISDIAMPGEDGYNLIARIRGQQPCEPRDLPAIAVTAYAGPEDVRRSLQSGFQAHVAKPIEAMQLAESMIRLLDEGRRPAAVALG